MIATSKRVDVSGVDQSTIEKVSARDYFTKDKATEKKSEEAFFKQGEKPQVCGVCTIGYKMKGGLGGLQKRHIGDRL